MVKAQLAIIAGPGQTSAIAAAAAAILEKTSGPSYAFHV